MSQSPISCYLPPCILMSCPHQNAIMVSDTMPSPRGGQKTRAKVNQCDIFLVHTRFPTNAQQHHHHVPPTQLPVHMTFPCEWHDHHVCEVRGWPTLSRCCPEPGSTLKRGSIRLWTCLLKKGSVRCLATPTNLGPTPTKLRTVGLLAMQVVASAQSESAPRKCLRRRPVECASGGGR